MIKEVKFCVLKTEGVQFLEVPPHPSPIVTHRPSNSFSEGLTPLLLSQITQPIRPKTKLLLLVREQPVHARARRPLGIVGLS